MIKNSPVTGIILAGGRNKRMGSNKALTLLNGKPLIEWVLNAMREVTDNVIISVGTEDFQYENLAKVQDEYPDKGPAGGIYSALKVSETDLNLVISCDMPFISVPVLELLIREARLNPSCVTFPVDENGYPQPLCAVYNKCILPVLHEAILQDMLMLRKIILECSSRQMKIGRDHTLYRTGIFMNINTKETLKRARNSTKNFN